MKNGVIKACMIIFACAAILTVSGCRRSNVKDTTAADIGSTDESTTLSTTQPITDATDSKDKLTQLLKSKTTDKILTFAYDDYDKDGKNEAFAFTGAHNKSEETYKGELWYVNANGSQKLMDNDEYWEVCKKLDFEKRSYCVMEKFFATGSTSYVWGVVNGEAKEEAISGKVNGLNMTDGVLLGTQSAYDMTYDKVSKISTGHTWKSYYFYEDNGIKEYGGKVITKAEFLKIDGASDILDGIKNQGGEITNIIYRANGIINLNYYNETDSSIDYYSKKVIYEKTHFKVIGTEDGIYLLALIPDIANYPNTNLPKYTFYDLIVIDMLKMEINNLTEQSKDIIEKGATGDIAAVVDDFVKKMADKTGLSVEDIKSYLSDISISGSIISTYKGD